jgi:hypothetical protein
MSDNTNILPLAQHSPDSRIIHANLASQMSFFSKRSLAYRFWGVLLNQLGGLASFCQAAWGMLASLASPNIFHVLAILYAPNQHRGSMEQNLKWQNQQSKIKNQQTDNLNRMITLTDDNLFLVYLQSVSLLYKAVVHFLVWMSTNYLLHCVVSS